MPLTKQLSAAIGELTRSCAVLAQILRLRRVSLSLYRTAVFWKPTDPLLLFDYGWTCSQFRRPQEAEDALRRVVELSGWTAAKYVLGEVLIDQGRFSEAVALLLEVVREEPQDPFTHYNLGFALASLHRHEEALAAFLEAVRLNPDWLDASVYVGLCYGELGQFTRATPWLQKAVRRRGSPADHARFAANLEALRLLPEAEASYRAALAEDPRSLLIRRQLAQSLADQGKLLDALETLNETPQADDDPLALALRGVLLAQLGRLDSARQAALRAVELAPTLGDARHTLGYVELMRGDLTVALTRFEEALGIDPTHTGYLASRGSVLSQLGRHREAIETFEQVLALDPEFLERHQEAFAHYERARGAIGNRVE